MFESFPLLATQPLLPNFFLWSLFLVLFGLALGFVLGWAAKPTRKSATSAKSAGMGKSGAETVSAPSVSASASVPQSSLPSTIARVSESSAGVAGVAEAEGLPQQSTAATQEKAAPQLPEATPADPNQVIQSRQPVARPIGEIERRRQRFEEAKREEEQKRRK